MIEAGNYTVAERHLEFELTTDVALCNGFNCYCLRGGNGFGKTSFIEKVAIPRLDLKTVKYIYIGQDIRTQFYTIKAMLSIQGHKVFGVDEVELLRLWISNSPTASVLILDELDKYFEDFGFIFDWSSRFINTYIIVSHRLQTSLTKMPDCFKVSHLIFEASGLQTDGKKIRIRRENQWQS